MPSPQSMLAMKSAVVATGLASVKVATTVVLGSATPVLGVSRVAGPAVRVASAMTAVEAPVTVIGSALPSSVTATTTW